nr:uncharacterized protein LOC116285423 isoform X2 [Vicugna pacos]
MVLMNEPSPLQICTDSWAVYRGLTLWIPQWALQDWMIWHWPLWGQQMWKQLWDKGQEGQYTVYHVPGHRPALAPGNDAADTLAQLRPVEAMVPGPDIGPWLHKKLGHVGSYTMKQAADQWGLHLSHSEAKDAVQQCPWCAKHHLHRWRWPQQLGKIAQGIQPLQVWQIDYVGPFAPSTGLWYLLTPVDTTAGLGFAQHVLRATQEATIRALEVLRAFYGTPLEIQSDRGTPFTAQQTQEWAKENDINWISHVPYCPQEAGMIERYNGLLKEKLRALKPQGRGWNSVFPQAVHLLNEQPRHTG